MMISDIENPISSNNTSIELRSINNDNSISIRIEEEAKKNDSRSIRLPSISMSILRPLSKLIIIISPLTDLAENIYTINNFDKKFRYHYFFLHIIYFTITLLSIT